KSPVKITTFPVTRPWFPVVVTTAELAFVIPEIARAEPNAGVAALHVEIPPEDSVAVVNTGVALHLYCIPAAWPMPEYQIPFTTPPFAGVVAAVKLSIST